MYYPWPILGVDYWLMNNNFIFWCFISSFIWNLINIISVLKKCSYDSYGCIIFRYEKAKIFSNLTTNHLFKKKKSVVVLWLRYVAVDGNYRCPALVSHLEHLLPMPCQIPFGFTAGQFLSEVYTFRYFLLAFTFSLSPGWLKQKHFDHNIEIHNIKPSHLKMTL